ncbi:MAG TPA: hypothetical protein VF591_07465 [Pyrinomonadaceae bacterium]
MLAITLASLAALAPCGEPSRAQAPRGGEGCPEIVAAGRPDVGLHDTNITFQVKHAPQSLRAKVTYNWTLTAGTIVAGQGTDAVTTDLTGVRSQTVEVTVEVGGLSGSCAGSVSYTLPPVIGCGRPYDEYGNVSFEDEQARLDNYAIGLSEDPTAEGHLTCYGGRKGRAGEAERRCVRAKKYLVETRGLEASRLLIVDGGFREELTVVLWLVPAGAQPPQPSPTVDPAEAEISDAPPEPKGRRVRR